MSITAFGEVSECPCVNEQICKPHLQRLARIRPIAIVGFHKAKIEVNIEAQIDS